MKPIKLEFRGIYSYQKEVKIDFDKLTQDGLFGIFGKVGSGKSSILEAISYVLYGKLERLNQQDRLSYNLMNLQSNDFFIEFDFAVDQPQESKFRFRVRAKRSGKKFEEVRTPERNQYIWDSKKKDWKPRKLSAEEVLGLSYENFRRTIIIPQGKFQDFLNLSETDRSTMMRELFNLHSYHLLPKLGPLRNKNKEAVTVHNAQLALVKEFEPSMLDFQQAELAETRKAVTQHQSNLKATQAAIQAQEQAKAVFEDLATLEAQLSLLEGEMPNWKTREKELQRYDLCQSQFAQLLQRLEEEQSRSAHLERTITQQAKNQQVSQTRASQLTQEIAEIQTAYEQREQLLQKAKELEIIQKSRKQSDENQQLAEKLELGEKYIDENDKNISEVEKKRLALQQEILTIKEEMPDLEQTSKVEAWFIQRDNILDEIQSTHQKIQKAKQSVERDLNTLWVAITEEFDEEDIAVLSKESEAISEFLTQNLEELQTKRQEVQENINRLAIQEKLQEFAAHLHAHPDEPCPLCGSHEHPNIMSVDDVNSKTTELKEQQTELRQYQERQQALKEQAIASQSRQKLQSNQIIKDEQHLKHEQKGLDKHKQKFIWKDFDPEDASEVQKLQGKIKRLQKKIEEREKQTEKLVHKSKELQEKREKYRKRKDELARDLAVGQSRLQQLEQQIQELKPEDYAKYSVEELAQQQKDLHKQHQELTQRYDSLNQQRQKAESEAQSQAAALEVHRKNLSTSQNALSTTRESLNQRLSKGIFANIEEVKNILRQKIDVQTERQAIQDFMQKYHSLKSQKSQLEQKKQGMSYDPVIYAELKTKAEHQEAAYNNQQRRQIEQEAAIKRLEKDLFQKQKLQKALKMLEQRAENIKTLESLFRKEGFVQYVSAIYLRQICQIANQRFQTLTNNNLQLELNDRYMFEVRDVLNGGQTRSVKTLSGGQTFQAALSLALALADSIQLASNSSHNFFFLDEGFGSQDDESLRIVFQTLQNLKTENRVVGVISHVENLQREISVYLNIHNDIEDGSQVRESWKMG